MKDTYTIGNEAIDKWVRYRAAYRAKSRWAAEEKAAKEQLLLALGYDPDDEKPEPALFVDSGDAPICEVRVSRRKGLDITYLKEKHPEIYAECEKWSHPISIRPAEDGPASTSGTA